MTKVQKLHNEAMGLAEEAAIEQAHGRSDVAWELLKAAYRKEREAAELLSADLDFQPTRSVLYRSAASLALECLDTKGAAELIVKGLMGHPPAEIAQELRDLSALCRSEHDPEGQRQPIDRRKSRQKKEKTMSAIPDGRATQILKRNTALHSQLQTTREAVKGLLEDLKHKHFTKHDVNHSDRVVEKLNLLARTLRKPLAEEECYILLSAAYLHDVGMQSDERDNLKLVRDDHHLLSDDIIMGSVRQPGKYPDLKINKDYAEYIARVARGHRKTDLLADEYEEFDIGGNQIRLRLLAALLRFADQLDIDFRRVDFERLKLERDMTPESKLHWYKHYYVLGTGLHDGLIRITYRFPEEYRNQEIENLIAKYVLDHVLKEYERYKEDIFWSAGVQISTGKDKRQYSSIVPALPPDVLAELEKTIGLAKVPASLANWSTFVNRCSSETRDTISREIGPKYLRQVYVSREIEDEFEDFLKGDKKLFLLSGKPGTGKTNLFCFLSQRYIPSLLLTFAEDMPDEPEFENLVLKSLGADPAVRFQTVLEKINSLSIPQSKNFVIFIDSEFRVGEFSSADCFMPRFLEHYASFNIKVAVACRGDLAPEKWPPDVVDLIHKPRYGPLTGLNISGILGDFSETEFAEARDRYFSSFNIRIAGEIEDEALVRLQHPYLLRLFCESYKNSRDLGPIKDIRYVDLCRRYWNNVYEKLQERFTDAKIGDIKNRLFNLVKNMRVNWMSSLDEGQFKKLIHEDVFEYMLAEGILSSKNGKLGAKSNFGFTFGEFQEFLMSEQILNEYDLLKSDEGQVTQRVSELIENSHRVRFKFGLGLVEFSILLLEKLRQDNVFNKIIEMVAERPEDQWKRLVCRCIAKLENIDDKTFSVLRRISSSKDEGVLIELAETLGVLAKKIPEPSELLLLDLMQKYDEKIRMSTAAAMLRFDESRMGAIIPNLMELSKDQRWRVSTALAEALGNLDFRDMRMFLPLIEELRQKGDSNTLTSLAKTLKIIGPNILPESVDILARIAGEGHGLHKSEAIYSLSTLASYDTNRVTEIYNSLCKSRDAQVRQAIARTVHLVDRNIAQKIWEELSDDEDMLVRMAVWGKLVEVGEVDSADTSILQRDQKYFGREPFRTVVKREGQVEMFQFDRIARSIFAAAREVGGTDYELATSLAKRVIRRLTTLFPGEPQIRTQQINDMVERILMEHGHARTARSYLSHRFNKYGSSGSR